MRSQRGEWKGGEWIKRRRNDFFAVKQPKETPPKKKKTTTGGRMGYSVDNVRGVQLYTVNGNQWSVGGLEACASVSFQATWFMTFADDIPSVIDKVEWENHVLVFGERLWRSWRLGVRRRDNCQSLSDIMDIPNMNRCLEHMGPRTEFYGPLHIISDREYADKVRTLITKEMPAAEVRRLIMVKLTDALRTMTTKARQPGQTHSVAMIFSSGATISVYAHHAGEFVIYDSHGTYSMGGKSSLFRCSDVGTARDMIRTIMSSFHKASTHRAWEDTLGAWSVNTAYNICIFSSGERVDE